MRIISATRSPDGSTIDVHLDLDGVPRPFRVPAAAVENAQQISDPTRPVDPHLDPYVSVRALDDGPGLEPSRRIRLILDLALHLLPA